MAGLGTPQMQGAPQQGMGMQQQSMQQQSMQQQSMQQPMEDEGSETGGRASASPKEQAAYEEFAQTLSEVLYPANMPGQVFPQILSNLQGQFDPKVLSLFEGVEPALTDSPQDSVAATSVLVTLVVDKKMGLLDQSLAAQAQGGMENEPGEERPGQPEEDKPGYNGENEDEFTPEAVLMEGGKLAVEELIEIAEAAKLHDFQQDEVDGVFYRALDLFRVAQEKINPAVVGALQKGFEQLRMADQQGQLGKILPGLPGGAAMPGKAA